MTKAERDADIIKRYRAGETIQMIQQRYGLTRGRMYQIFKKAGVHLVRGKTSERDLFLGINISEPVKDALLIEADKRGVSMSSLSAASLKEMLIACGYPLEAEKIA